MDVLCIDKTGTITDGALRVVDVVTAPGRPDAVAALGAVAAGDPRPNATLAAIASSVPPPAAGWDVVRRVAFWSERKWSAVEFEGRRLVLGGPDVVATDLDDELLGVVDDAVATGRRVLVLVALKVLSGDHPRTGGAIAARAGVAAAGQAGGCPVAPRRHRRGSSGSSTTDVTRGGVHGRCARGPARPSPSSAE